MADVATLQQVEPTTAHAVADVLREANDKRQTVVARGNGTKARWGVSPARTDILLSLRHLNTPIEHCAGDLTVTAPAGATLAAINQVLAREGQWLPLDPWAGGRSTVGGIVATNDSGPRRHRYGAPRDLLIGIEFALANGCLAKSGGRVVKNVAGYDVGRLLCGSFGTLAVITAATFKLSPKPPASRTVLIEPPTDAVARALLTALARSPLTPAAAEVALPGPHYVVRFESTDAAADHQATNLCRLASQHGARATTIAGADEEACWQQHASRVAENTGTLLRVGVLPTEVPSLLTTVQSLAADKALRVSAIGRALMGALLIRVDGDADAIAALVVRLRADLKPKHGHVSILATDPDRSWSIPRWHDVGSPTVAQLMRAVKAEFDPRGTLCPGGGPGGLA